MGMPSGREKKQADLELSRVASSQARDGEPLLMTTTKAAAIIGNAICLARIV
jgi:hypothetical protein